MESSPGSDFARALCARAAADAHVVGGMEVGGDVKGLLAFARSASEDEARYPYDVLWRDVGVLDGSLRGAKAAGRAFQLAKKALKGGGDSPVTTWKAYGVALSEAAVRSPDGPPPTAPDGLNAAGTTASEASVAYRRASPY